MSSPWYNKVEKRQVVLYKDQQILCDTRAAGRNLVEIWFLDFLKSKVLLVCDEQDGNKIAIVLNWGVCKLLASAIFSIIAFFSEGVMSSPRLQ